MPSCEAEEGIWVVVAEVEGDNRGGRVKVFVFAGPSRSVRRGRGSQRESAASPAAASVMWRRRRRNESDDLSPEA
jgi:hypothetical protein